MNLGGGGGKQGTGRRSIAYRVSFFQKKTLVVLDFFYLEERANK